MGKKVLLIQPHSDDIILSASHYLYSKDFSDKVILTVENNPKRLLEDQEICNHFGASLSRLETRADSTDFHKLYYKEHAEMDDKTAMKFCQRMMGKENLAAVVDELETVVSQYKKKGYLIVTCLGVGHPFHWLTRVVTEDAADVFYRDFPHSYKRRNQAYLNGLVNSKFNLEFTHGEKHVDKIALFKQYYKTQSGFLFFEQGYINKQLPEEFYTKL